jgi:hypothetical protein
MFISMNAQCSVLLDTFCLIEYICWETKNISKLVQNINEKITFFRKKNVSFLDLMKLFDDYHNI